MNTHQYAPNPVEWVDPLGLERDKKKKATQSPAQCDKCEINPCRGKGTSYASRREAMRQAGVPVSSRPLKKRGDVGYEQHLYQVGSDPTKASSFMVVSHHPKDGDHPCPHWHVGMAKQIEKGSPTTFSNGAWKYVSGGPTVEHE